MKILKIKKNKILMFLFLFGGFVLVVVGVVIYKVFLDFDLVKFIFFLDLFDLELVNSNNVKYINDLIRDKNVIEKFVEFIKVEEFKIELIIVKIFKVEELVIIELFKEVLKLVELQFIIVSLIIERRKINFNGVEVYVIVEVILDRKIIDYDK